MGACTRSLRPPLPLVPDPDHPPPPRRARAAATTMQSAPLAARNAALVAIKVSLAAEREVVLAANRRDCEEASKEGVSDTL